MAEPQTLAELVAYLQHAQGGASYIDFGSALLAEAGSIATYIDPAKDSFRITQGTAALIQPGDDEVTIAGEASLFPQGIAYAVAAIGRVSAQGAISFDVSLTPKDAAWAFRSNFPPADDYFPPCDGFDFTDQIIGSFDSFFNDIALAPAAPSAPIFRVSTGTADHPAGLTIAAVLDATKGTLGDHLADYLPGANSLSLTGTIAWPAGAGFPLLRFQASLDGVSLPKAGSALLELETVPASADAPAASTAALSSIVNLPGFNPLDVSASVIEGPFLWRLKGRFDPVQPFSLGQGLEALASFAGTSLTLPSGVAEAGQVGLVGLDIGIEPSAAGLDALAVAGATISFGGSWSLPLTGIEIGGIQISWDVVNPLASPVITGRLTGSLFFGDAQQPTTPHLQVHIDMTAFSGEEQTAFAIEATLDPENPLALTTLFNSLTGLDIDISDEVTVTALDLGATSSPRAFFFYAGLDNQWQPFGEAFQLDTIGFAFDYTAGSWSAAVTAGIVIGGLPLAISAAYRGAGQGWRFEGGLVPTQQAFTLKDFLADLLPWTPPDEFEDIALTGLSAWLETQSGESGFSAAVQWQPQQPFFGSYTITGAAAFSLQHLKAPGSDALAYSGYLAGSLQVNALIVTVQYNFGIATGSGGGTPQYQFSIAYKGVSLTGSVTKNEKGEDLLSISLGGVDFGDILDFLVDLADPGANYRLPSPWDALYGVSLDGLTLSVNMTTKEVGVTYRLGLELGFARIDTVGLSYRDQGGLSGVEFAMTGRFGDQQYDPGNALSWDLLNDPPPTPAGKGEELLDLRFMALGQNVGFAQPAAFTSIPDVIAAMEAGFAPAGATGPGPLVGNDALAYTGDGRWLIGADFTVADTVALQVVFNDPALYGLHVSLAGEKAKKLAGLDFEILYKRITDTLGVYQIDLTLPSAMRQIDFGAVSLTLPPIGIDIYTNGDFYIDCGFPTNMDFSKSACVQAATFTGYGGFYFGVLDGATSNQVPTITNGTFSPVIEVGIAMSIGMGRTFNEGVLQAGLTVSVAGSLEGAFGWFVPTDKSLSSELYYRVVGIAELRGHLYGAADFIIISARVDVVAFARLTLIIESYEPILVEITLGVEVEASIKIVFFTVHFSFSTSIDFSFTIGSGSQPPWIVAPGSPPVGQLAQQRRAQWRRPASGAALHRRLLAALGDKGDFDWSNMPSPAEPSPLPLTAVVSLTVSNESSAGPTAPAPNAVLSLYADNSVEADARSVAEIRNVVMEAPQAAPFNRVAAGVLRWALDAYLRPGDPDGPSTYVLASDLDAILGFLKDQDNWRQAFGDNLDLFLERNFLFQISSPQAAGTSGPTGASGPPPSVSVFPVIPALSMTGPAGLVRFDDKGLIGQGYEAALDAYYAQLTPTVPTGGTGPADATDARGAAGPESLSSFIFRDYFAMVAKGAADSARAMLKAYPYPPTGASMAGPSGPAETLASIAALFPGPTLAYDAQGWESLAMVSGRLGVPIGALRAANPGLAGHDEQRPLPRGTTILVETGASPQGIVAANPAYPLQHGPAGPSALPLNGVQHQVMAPGPSGFSESIATIAYAYDLTPEAIFSGPTGAANVASTQLLAPGASFWVPAAGWAPASGLSLDDTDQVAAFFAARAMPAAAAGDGQWYEIVSYVAQYIYANNSSLTGPTWAAPLMGWTGPSGASGPTGLTPILVGATAYNVQGASQPGPSAPARDTPELAAAAISLFQLAPEPQADAYRAILAGISSGPGGLSTSPFQMTAPPGASLGAIADSLGLNPAGLAGYNAGLTGLLRPLAVVALPTVDHVPEAGDTLGSVATAYDLTPAELADSLASLPRLLQPWSDGTAMLSIPDLPGRTTDDLVCDLATFGRFNDVSGMVSRFLLHGMRVPPPATGPVAPFPPDVAMAPVYALDGQQFAVPIGPQGATGFTLELASGASWATFLPAGPSGPDAATLSLAVDAAFIAEHLPAPVLEPDYLADPAPLPLFIDQQRHYPLHQSIHWQSAAPVGPTGLATGSGQPSIWPLPPQLQAIAALGATMAPGPAWGLFATQPGDAPGASAPPVLNFGWASAVSLRLRRVRDTSGSPVPNLYLVMGSDAQGKDILLQLWQSIADGGNQLFIAYPPSVSSGNAQGLASQALDLDATAILKAGLSTVTHSGGALAAVQGAASGLYFATAAATADFVKLAWEACVTAEGGFYLTYRTAAKDDLPPALFGADDEAEIRLIVLPQADLAWGGEPLMPFNNVAIVGENLPTHANVFARPADPTLDFYRAAAAPPGNAGYYFARANPDFAVTSGALGPSAQTQSLFHLTGCQILGNDDFEQSNRAMPAGPLSDKDPAAPGPTGPGIWHYRGLYPVHRFGKANACPDSAALPPADDNPYRGIGGASGSGLGQAEFALSFHDVFGNQTDVAGGLPTVTAPVGYTDEIIGVAGWPGAAAVYAFRPGEGGAILLEVQLSLQPGRYAPSGSYGFAQASQAATADSARYTQIFYQAQQPDYRFSLATNVGTLAADPLALKASLSAFATKALVYCGAAGAQRQCILVTGDKDTLPGLAETWRVDVAGLVRENKDQLLSALFAGPVVVPEIAAAAPSRSLLDYAAAGSIPPGGTFPPACGAERAAHRRGAGLRMARAEDLATAAGAPAAPSPTPLTPLEVASWNAAVPLSPGLVLSVPASPRQLPGPASLDGAAAVLGAAAFATIPGPGQSQQKVGLYWDNYEAKVIADGITLDVNGKQVITTSSDSFSSLLGKAQPGKGVLSDADFVSQIRGVAGLLAGGPLQSASLVVPTPAPGAKPVFSLQNLPRAELEAVVAANQWTGGVFVPGQPLFLGYSCLTPSETDTFASLAADANVPIEALAVWNNGPLAKGATMNVPALTRIDPQAPAYAAYSPRSPDSLDSIAGAFALGPTGYETIAALTAELPGIFADQVVVQGPSGATVAAPTDSLATIAAKLGTTTAALVGAIHGATGLYRPGAALLAPLPRVPGEIWSPPIATLAEQFNLSGPNGLDGAAMLLDANRSLDGFLRAGATLAGPVGATPLQVMPHDTVGTVMAALQAGTTAPFGLSELAAANQGATGLLAVGATFLLPPDPTLVRLGLQPKVPPAGLSGPDAIAFPVSVRIGATRDSSCVDPDFLGPSGAPSVWQVSAAVGPEGATLPNGSVDLAAFAAGFEQAFAGQRLKCAVARDGSSEDAKIWALNLGPAGASGIAVDSASPAFYGLAPLSTALMSGALPIAPYRSGAPLGPTATQSFASIDLDAWMLTFANAVDMMLSPQYAAAAYSTAAGPSGPAFAPDGPLGLDGNGRAVGAGPSGLGDGRGAFDRIVAAKLVVAQGLTGQVMPILDGVGASAGPPLEAARDTLYQRMLDRLADAYGVSAIVQYPVAMSSPCGPTSGPGPYPPRLAGRVVPVLYTIPGGAAGSLAAAATSFGVSAPSLAASLLGVRGLLAPRAVAQFAGKSVTIASGDTFATLAAAFGVAPSDWASFTGLIEALAPQALLAPNAKLPATAIRRSAEPGENARAIADFFGMPVEALFQANQEVPGLYAQGAQIVVPGSQPYVVKPNDTLLDIVQATGWTIAEIAQWAEDPDTGGTAYLVAGTQTAFAAPLVEFDVSATKIELSSDADGQSRLSFALSLKRPQEHRNLFLNLQYVASEVEYGIFDVIEAPGYQASSWLTLVRPLGTGVADDGAELGMAQVQIPIPLPFYPTAPTLLAQASAPSPIGATAPADQIREARAWNYSFDVATDNAAQDTTHLDILFNAGPGSAVRDPLARANAAAPNLALFGALAQFISTWPQLQQDLARLVDPQYGSNDPIAAMAVEVFAQIAEGVGAAFAFTVDMDAFTDGAQRYRYRMITTADIARSLAELQLVDEDGGGAPWPTVLVDVPGLSGATFQPLTAGGTAGATAVYHYPAGIPADAPLAYRFVFEERDLLSNLNGWGGAWLSRNDDLISSGPLGAGPGPQPPALVSVASEFVYVTPIVRFVEPLTPFIDRQQAIDVSGLSGPNPPPDRSIEEHLENMFAAVLATPAGPTSAMLSTLVSYGFAVTPVGPTASFPVLMLPAQFLGPAGIEGAAGALGRGLRQWRDGGGGGAAGALSLDLTLFGQPVGGSMERPLLELEQLNIGMASIDWNKPPSRGGNTEDEEGGKS